MCNHYCLTKGPQAILKLARAMKDRMGRANGALGIVARRDKEDEGGLAVWRS